MDTEFNKFDSRITEVKEEIIHQFRVIAQDWMDKLDQLTLVQNRFLGIGPVILDLIQDLTKWVQEVRC